MDLYFVILIILFILAISGLVVGVSNDAVNFLNSAIGSKVAPRYIIMIIASLGILVGTTFSSGLMEVARKGIFNPEMFYFPDIMMIFFAVMLADVLLLDLYNTFGLPTSTTVAIVFNLLGAGVAISVIKITESSNNIAELINYINTSKALAIISGILVSVVVAFTTGVIIQYIVRLIFTFDFERRIKRYGAIFGAFALTAITFFILFKGIKGASFISAETADYLEHNVLTVMIYSFVGWGILFQLILWFTKINILKPVVLMGTFALALAFAANDLVNFIGVPLAGLTSYEVVSSMPDPFNHLMSELSGKVTTPTALLLLSGFIMVLALIFSRKARTVTKTEINLGRQDEGFERFESSLLARIIVRMSISLLESIKKITPDPVIKVINNRFDISNKQLQNLKGKDAPAFDLLRASINLILASILISFATSLKLPLSTTYVTFMVAMGTSLSDRAWGRDSAVYRVNGVITVIAGWFFTALMAFTVAAVFAVIIYYGGLISIIVLVILGAYTLFRTHIIHRIREKEEEEVLITPLSAEADSVETIRRIFDNITVFFGLITTSISKVLDGLATEDRVILREEKNSVKLLKKHTNIIVGQIINSVKLLKDNEVKQGRRFGKIIASLQEIQAYLREFHQFSQDHIENNHGKPSDAEINDLRSLTVKLESYINMAGDILRNKSFEDLSPVVQKHEELKNSIHQLDENEIIRIKENQTSSRNSMLYLNLLADLEYIATHVNELIGVCKKNYVKIIPPVEITIEPKA